MQKYDDFGRPIYETAEEYNRAHRMGGMSYSSDGSKGDFYTQEERQTARHQTAAQRHATREGSKKAKTVVLGIIAFAIALNLVIILSVSGNMVGSAVAEPEVNYDDTWEGNHGEYLGDVETPLPEGFENFIYNGESYTLPTTYETISQMGFVLEEAYELDDMIPTDFNEMLSLCTEDGYTAAMVIVTNNTEKSIPLAQCTVEYFYIENPATFDVNRSAPDFTFGAGINFESTYEDLEAYLGVPYYHYEDHSEEGYYYDAYEWSYYGDDEYHHVNIVFWNGEISDISIQKECDSMQL